MSDIFVNPMQRCGGFVVVADVAHELAGDALYRSENPARDNLALNLGKPNFDLVEPAGVGRGVVDPNCRVGLKECKNSLGLVRTQVIDNDVDLASWRLAGYDLGKEIDELRGGVTSTGFSQHLSGLSIQSAVKRKRSMAVVLKAMPFGPARRKGQNRIQAVQRLDSTLLVDAEYSSVHRWVEVQPNDISRFLFKLRIIAGQVAARTVGLESKLPPHSADRRLTDPHLLGQPITAPMGRAVGRSASSQLQNTGFGLSRAPAMLGSAVTRIQATQALLLKTLLPKANVAIGATQSFANFTIRATSG